MPPLAAAAAKRCELPLTQRSPRCAPNASFFSNQGCQPGCEVCKPNCGPGQTSLDGPCCREVMAPTLDSEFWTLPGIQGIYARFNPWQVVVEEARMLSAALTCCPRPPKQALAGVRPHE